MLCFDNEQLFESTIAKRELYIFEREQREKDKKPGDLTYGSIEVGENAEWESEDIMLA